MFRNRETLLSKNQGSLSSVRKSRWKNADSVYFGYTILRFNFSYLLFSTFFASKERLRSRGTFMHSGIYRSSDGRSRLRKTSASHDSREYSRNAERKRKSIEEGFLSQPFSYRGSTSRASGSRPDKAKLPRERIATRVQQHRGAQRLLVALTRVVLCFACAPL